MKDLIRLTNENFPEPIGAYSNGISIPIGGRKLVVLTGQLAIDFEGRAQYIDEPDKQTEYIFENIRSLLNEAGGDIDNLIRIVIYVTDMKDFTKISLIRDRYLKDVKPVSTLIEASKLTIEGCRVEIEATAII